MALVVKTALDPQALVPQVRAAVQADRSRAADRRRADDGPVDWPLAATRRAPTLLLALFGAVALLLSAIGIYGVLAFGVAQRVREFGIRQALGADRGVIVRMVLQQGDAHRGRRRGAGPGGARWRSRASCRASCSAWAPATWRCMPVSPSRCSRVALVACYLPARGTTRIDPMAALRES